MSQIYRITADGAGEALQRIHCRSEDEELQRILEKNFNLLPGDQIAPEDPCRWLLIRREMPVPDPTSGIYRWNIDFLFADQNAKPTLVECKRFNSTQARREVVGQMMEYAANGHHYWSAAELSRYAIDTAATKGTTFQDELKRLGWPNSEEPDVFFQKIEENLREGQVRLVFFLEDASFELKSVVEFLNRQMERSEVLLVEARQYQLGDSRIISPVLFGYSEEARMVKRKVTVDSATRGAWNAESFFALTDETLKPRAAQAIRALFESCVELGANITWGKGKDRGSFSTNWPHLCSQNLFSVYTDGRMEVPFGSMNKNEKDMKVRDEFKNILVGTMKLTVSEANATRFPGFNVDQWINNAGDLPGAIQQLLDSTTDH